HPVEWGRHTAGYGQAREAAPFRDEQRHQLPPELEDHVREASSREDARVTRHHVGRPGGRAYVARRKSREYLVGRPIASRRLLESADVTTLHDRPILSSQRRVASSRRPFVGTRRPRLPERPAQQCPAAIEPRHHGAYRDPDHVGNLQVLELLYVAEQDDFLQIRRQPAQRPYHVLVGE